MLLKAKIRDLCSTPGGSKKRYHVRVDPLPSRYAKADEAAERIVNNQLMKAIGHRAVATLFTRDSKKTSGIALADVLLGAVMDDWCGDSTSVAEAEREEDHRGAAGLDRPRRRHPPLRVEVQRLGVLGPNLRTSPGPAKTRDVQLRYPMNLVERRARKPVREAASPALAPRRAAAE